MPPDYALTDTLATARYLKLRPAGEPSDGELLRRDLRLPLGGAGRIVLNRLVHPAGRLLGDERVYYREALRARLPLGRRELLVRVDDYPRADLPTRRFFEFARILADRGVQLLLGVTPLLPRGRNRGLTDEELVWLTEATAADRVRIATHGTTHQNRNPERGHHSATELCGMPRRQLRASVSLGFETLVHAGLPRPLHYIPPFNSVDAAAWEVLAETYPFIHGGPISLDTLGPFAPGAALGKAIYLPSYRPWYARARELVDRVAREPRPGTFASENRVRFPLVLTLHWAWEQPDGMRALRLLAAALEGRTGRWQEWEHGAPGGVTSASPRSAPAPRSAATDGDHPPASDAGIAG